MNNTVTITFSRNFVAGDSIGVYYSDPSTQTSGYWTFTWVNGTAGAFQVQIGTPTTTTGEIEAIRFASAWTNSLNGFTVTQPVSGNDNQVQITSQTYHFVNVLAKFSDGTTMAIPTDYNYALSTVSTGNKITYEDKLPLNTPTADSKYLWKSVNANEVKEKHNLNDDRIGVLEQETQEIRNNLDDDFTMFGNKNSVYELAEDTKMIYKKGATEEEIITALNSTSLGGFHGFRYVEKYKTIYATARGTTSGQVEIYIFNDLNDITNYSTVTITTGDTSFSGSDQIIYSSYKDKLYIVPNDSGYTTTYLQVWELNPSNNTVIKVIDLDVTGTVDYPYFCPTTIIDNHLFVGSGVYTTVLFKFDLNDYTLSDSLEISPTGNQTIHGLTTDGEKIWVTSYSNISVESSYIARVNPTNMSLEDIQYTTATNASVGGGVADDIVLVGDYLYLPLENFAVGGILKVNKNDLTDQTVLQVPLNAANDILYAIYFDGINVWYAGKNDNLGKINIKTEEAWLYENPFSYSINEIQTDGQRMFVTGFDVYPVNNTGYVGRTLFPTKPIKKVILKSDGSVAQEIDYSTGNTTVEGNIILSGNVNLNENSRVKLDVDVDDTSYILHDGTNVYASANDHKFIQGTNGNYAEVHTGNLYEHFTITSLTSSSNLTDASRFLLYNLTSNGTLTISSSLGADPQEWEIVNASGSNTLTVSAASGVTLDFINNDGNNGVISAAKSATLVRYEEDKYYLIKH